MLEGLKPPVRMSSGCKVVKIADGLSADDSKLFMQYVDDPNWVAEQLMNALAERGVFIGAMAIRKHRKGICMCTRGNDA